MIFPNATSLSMFISFSWNLDSFLAFNVCTRAVHHGIH